MGRIENGRTVEVASSNGPEVSRGIVVGCRRGDSNNNELISVTTVRLMQSLGGRGRWRISWRVAMKRELSVDYDW